MALARSYSIALVGVEGHTVEVEADIANGLIGLLLVGLPDTALREARDRIRSAIVNSDQQWPQRKITVGLSPASLPKRGSAFDLAIAAAILAADGVLPVAALASLVLLGELGLDGRLRPVRGILPATASAAAAGFATVAVPRVNAPEAALVPGVRVLGVPSLTALLAHLRRDRTGPGTERVAVMDGGTFPLASATWPTAGARLAAVAEGSTAAKPGRPATEAGGYRAAGRMVGADQLGLRACPAPGGGAGQVAARDQSGLDLADVLGQPVARRAIEICAAGGHHLAMLGPPGAGKTMLAERLPTVLPRLDLEAALEALRQPLESGAVVVARSGLTARFPARFTLVLAANPCPCARSAGPHAACTCTATVKRRYFGRLSGPLLDRVDVKVELFPVGKAELLSDRRFADTSATVAGRVELARQRAAFRLAGTPWRLNAQLPGRELRRRFAPAAGALARLERSMELGQLSARGVDRILRVAWTLADLAGKQRPTPDETAYALGLWLGVTQ